MRRPLKAIDKKEGNRDQVWDFARARKVSTVNVEIYHTGSVARYKQQVGRGAAQVAPRQQKKK